MTKLKDVIKNVTKPMTENNPKVIYISDAELEKSLKRVFKKYAGTLERLKNK